MNIESAIEKLSLNPPLRIALLVFSTINVLAERQGWFEILYESVNGSVATLLLAVAVAMFVAFDALPFVSEKWRKLRFPQASDQELFFNMNSLPEGPTLLLGFIALNRFFERDKGRIPEGLVSTHQGTTRFNLDLLTSHKLLDAQYDDSIMISSPPDRYVVAKALLKDVERSRLEVFNILQSMRARSKDAKLIVAISDLTDKFNKQGLR